MQSGLLLRTHIKMSRMFAPLSHVSGRGVGGEGVSIHEVRHIAAASAHPLPRPLSRKRERGEDRLSF